MTTKNVDVQTAPHRLIDHAEIVNPWTTLSSQTVYDNPWIRVSEFDVIHPSGCRGIYGVVHFKHLAIGAIPYESGEVWLVGQYRYPLRRYS
ncbi:MAG: hypothetical protein RMM53_12580, partial [Bacteroidia bacterium]|nr:hypothetical protein [Bacteroidia bacterium]MDW8335043.1 hypothetical protein [Bacteroidia bacterium]